MVDLDKHKELFWNNPEVFEIRKEVILKYLTELDNQPDLHFNISYNLSHLPKDFNQADKRPFSEVFKKEPWRFTGPGRSFVVSSNDARYRIGTGTEGLSFGCDDIRNMEYNLSNDYLSQVILHYLMEANQPIAIVIEH